MTGPPEKEMLSTIMKRAEILRCISQGISEKRKIEANIDMSRSTINRAYSELEDQGLLQKSSGNFDLSLYGKIALEQYEFLIDSYGVLNNSSTIIRNISADSYVDLRLLNGAETVSPNERMPSRPYQDMKEKILNADLLKGFLSVEPPEFTEVVNEAAFSQNLTVELILEDELITALSDIHVELLIELVNSENSNLWQSSINLPYEVFIFDTEQVWMCVHQNGGGLCGIIRNNTNPAVEWANEIFNQYQEEAKALEYN